MQISKIITTIVATACVSTAVPTAHNDQPEKDVSVGNGNMICKGSEQLHCCDSVKGLVAIGCILNNGLLLTGGCNTQICCTNGSNCRNEVGLINIGDF